MRIFCHLSLAAFLLALALQFLVVGDANKGILAAEEDRQNDRAAQRAAVGSGETVAEQAPRKAFLEDFRNDMRTRVENVVGKKPTVEQISVGALILALVLWGVAVLRKEDRPYYGTNSVLLVLFAARWLFRFL